MGVGTLAGGGGRYLGAGILGYPLPHQDLDGGRYLGVPPMGPGGVGTLGYPLPPLGPGRGGGRYLGQGRGRYLEVPLSPCWDLDGG